MNAHRFENLGTYLAEFLAHLRIEQDDGERSTFTVEVHSEGLAADDLALLR